MFADFPCEAALNAAPERQKMTRATACLAAALGVAGATLLAACTDPSKPTEAGRIYTSVADCARERTHAECEDAWTTAREEHSKIAEAFAQLKDCERQWGGGRCQQAHDPNGGVWYTPQMAAFMIAHAVTAIGTPCKPDDTGCPKGLYVSHAVYVSPAGGVYTMSQKVATAQETRAGVALPRTVVLTKESLGAMKLR